MAIQIWIARLKIRKSPNHGSSIHPSIGAEASVVCVKIRFPINKNKKLPKIGDQKRKENCFIRLYPIMGRR